MRTKANDAMRRAVLIGLAVSALLVAAACAIPAALIKGIEKECLPPLEAARECALSGNHAEARRLLLKVREATEARSDALKLFFDHNAVAELAASVRTACDLALVRDDSQLTAEIDGAICALEFLSGLTRAGFGELM